MAVPTLVQHVSGSWTNGDAAVANGFILNLPNPSRSGNAIILAFTSKHLLTISSITDDQSSSWAASITAAVSKDDGAGIKTWIVVLPNCAANIVKITVTMSAVGVFQYQLTEFNNVATSSPIDVSVSATAVAGSSVATGSMTTTVDGDLIYQYAQCQHYPTTLGTTDNNPTTLATTPIWTAGSGFELLGGDWNTGYVSQWKVQTTHGAINPTCSISNNPATADTFTTVAVALKSAAAGTAASGMYIAHCLHTWSVNNVSPMWVQFPCTGNLLICSATNSPINAITSITDTPGNSWDCSKNTGNLPFIGFAPNATPSITNVLDITFDLGGQLFVVLYDVVGAATSPYDTKATASGTSSNTNADVTHAPDITPSTANGLVVVCNSMGLGPPSGVDLPVGGIFDALHYTSKSDVGADSGDGYAHFWNSSTAAEAWSWTMANGSVATSWAALAIAFKAPAAGGGSPFTTNLDNQPSYLKKLTASHVALRAEGEVWENPQPIRLNGKDLFPGGPGKGPNYDWPNPEKWRAVSVLWPISLRTHTNPMEPFAGKDVFFGPAGKAPNFDWPNPVGTTTKTSIRWPIDLRTYINPLDLTLYGKDVFFGGPGQPVQHDPPQNPRGYPFPLEDRSYTDASEFWILKDNFFGGPGQPPSYDPPQNPRGYPFPLEDRTEVDASEFWMLQDTFFGGPGQPPSHQPPENPRGYGFSNEFRTLLENLLQTTLSFNPIPFNLLEWPNPRGYGFPLDGRTEADGSEFWMLQDTFFGGPGQPPTYQPPDNPRGYQFSVEFRTFLQNLLETTLFFNPVPFSLSDWPNPRGYGFPLEDRSYTDASEFWMLFDTFYGAPGEPPTYAPAVNPRGYSHPVDARTLIVSLIATTLGILPNPFYTTEWPNPRGYQYSTQLRTFVEGLQEISLNSGVQPFNSPGGWTNPTLRPMTRGQVMDALNLLGTTLGPTSPVVNVLRRLLMGMGI